MSLNEYVQINLSLDELLSIYHSQSRVLSRFGRKVSVSIRQEGSVSSSQSLISFTEVLYGNYLLIATADVNKYWLLRARGTINTYEYKTVQLLFDCQGYESDTGNKFVVKKPAIVSLAPNNKDWKLEQRGILEFDLASTPSRKSVELEQAEEENQKIRSDLAELNLQLTKIKQENEQVLSRLNQLIKTHLVDIFNSNPKTLSQYAIEVLETSESIDNRRLGYNKPVAVEKVSRNKGIAWVIKIDGYDYLVPKPKLTINEYNYETIESLFNCKNYQSGQSQEFSVAKAAKLVSQGETWELSEKGELIFGDNYPRTIIPEPQPPIVSPAPIPEPEPPIVPPEPTPPKPPEPIPQLLELLYKAAFTGFEGGLLLIAIVSLLGTSLIGAGFWIGMLILASLIFLQHRLITTNIERLIIALSTLLVILIVPALQTILPIQSTLPQGLFLFLLAILSGLSAVTFISLYRLIFKVLEKYF